MREKLPVTPGPPRSWNQTPSLLGSSPIQYHHPELHEPKCPNPSAWGTCLHSSNLEFPPLLKSSRMPQLWSILELTTHLPSYTLRPSLLSNNTACFITKGALPLYPSQVSHTLLLYSEILDKYLTWLKGQTRNEERVKRDFSIHTHTHRASYITIYSVQNVLLTTGSFDKQSQVSYPLDQEGAVPLRPEAAHILQENTDATILTHNPMVLMAFKVLSGTWSSYFMLTVTLR